MPDEKLIESLNEALNREVTTFLRYMLQAASIKGVPFEPVREMYLEEVTDEVGHAQYLANQIRMLGGTPVLKPDLTPPPQDVKEMLKRDSDEEKIDVRNYAKLAEMAEVAGLYSLKMKMEEQAADEDEHAQEMRRLLG
jgi:bacterioferritin